MFTAFSVRFEYYRITGNERWKQAALNLYRKIREKEITLIGNGGGDQPYHPAVLGEAWDYTALEQTNPKMERMMETCVGVTWLKLCSQLCRLTGDSLAIDEIEKYAYNGLLGAMKPEGDGFSYVNRLNGVKTDPHGWGGTIDGVYVTCCNLNGPMGLAYLPFVAVMSSPAGPVINLYNACRARATTPRGQAVRLRLETAYPVSGNINLGVSLAKPERFTIKLRIPSWSASTQLAVNGKPVSVVPGTYAALHRKWSSGDQITLALDLRCRVVNAPHGSNRAGDHFQALVRGPIVLARDENLDANYDQPVALQAKGGYIDLTPVPTSLPGTRMQFRAPTRDGFIQVVDYSTINNWNGKHLCTWLPIKP